MKLHFKQQPYQVEAVKSVVDCFAGQPLKTNRFTLEKSREILRKAKAVATGAAPMEFDTEVMQEIGYRNSPIQLSESEMLRNIQAVQELQGLVVSKEIERPKGVQLGYNLTVEMETGTGKTYTYIRTMYELHKHYGWSKYIVIVPSIAIREGVFKSFELTQDHFQEIYGHRINPFIYNSGRPQDIETFASDSRISVMIINTQAFASSGADAKRIYQELDHFGTRKPIDIIAQTNPILIIDEPQSAEGEKTVKSMQDFRPLLTLRYSATHKAVYNKIYRLDALDAYQQKLVKKIQVKGINQKGSTGTQGYLYLEQISLSTTKPPYAVVEFEKRSGDSVRRVRQKLEEGANLYELSGNMPAYKNKVIQEINGYLNKIVVGGEDIYPGDVINDRDELAFRRIQIRETILSHLQKEKQLFYKGVKVLSLFFIDSVDKYRVYNEQGEEETGAYAKIFEEEYYNARNQFIDLFHQEYADYLQETDPSLSHKGYMPQPYEEYLKRDEASRVHQGYFSIDKKNRYTDPTTKRGSEDSDDISAYDLIMKDKERLLSMDEPTRFIFSHSALKEGWDNPNVFQICALKNADEGSQIRRRQEVGRGMRICVNDLGHRLDYDSVGEQVHEINLLTVIASESYESFAKGLQEEIASTLSARPQRASAEFLVGKLISPAGEDPYRLTKEDAQKLNKLLYKHDILDEDDRITPEGKERIATGTIPVPEHLIKYQEGVTKVLKAIYDNEAIKPEDGRQTIFLNPNKNFHRKEFQELWNKISFRTIYEVKFDTGKLIEDAVLKINAELRVSDRLFQIKSGTLKAGTQQDLFAGTSMTDESSRVEKVQGRVDTEARYDLIGEIESLTQLTRRTIATILQRIRPAQFVLVQKNPEEFIARCARLINEVKASLIINNIVYTRLDEQYDARTVFTNDKQTLRNSAILKRHIYDYLTSDSRIETEFAKALDESAEVVVYAKLPRNFQVATPMGNYSPDWAIVLDKEKVRHIYFVAETKGAESDMELREIEKLKIHCAREHFKAISGNEVLFDKVTGYDKLLEIIQPK